MKKRKLSIRRNLMTLFYIVFIIPMLVISLSYSWYYTRQAEEQNTHNINNILVSATRNLEIHFDKLQDIVFTPYLYKDVLTTMNYMRGGYLEEQPEYLELAGLESSYSLLFTKLLHTSGQDIQRLTFYPGGSFQDKVYAISRETARLIREDQPGYQEEEWYRRAANDNNFFFFPFQEEPLSEKNGFSMVYMIRDPANKKGVGVLKLDVNAENIIDMISEISIQGNSQLLLMDQEDRILYQSDPLDEDFITLFTEQSIELNELLRGYTVTQRKLENSGWRLVYLNSRQDVLFSQLFTYLAMLLIVIAAAVFSFVLFRHNTNSVVRGVTNILETLQEIQAGNLTAKSYVTVQNELGTISRAVNEMGDELSRYIDREYKAVIGQRNAEFQALQSQINPHFLYNTLSSFIALNRMGEKKILEDAIVRLTEMFRYSCNMQDVESLQNEIAFCEKYLYMQKMQFEDRLDFSIDIDPKTSDIHIPRLLLQPLVENAVIHGAGDSEEMLHITIKTRLKRTAIYIYVIDDGVGFDNHTDTNKIYTSVGLQNVTQRLGILYPEAQFKIMSKPNKGTICCILIPYTADNEEGLL